MKRILLAIATATVVGAAALPTAVSAAPHWGHFGGGHWGGGPGFSFGFGVAPYAYAYDPDYGYGGSCYEVHRVWTPYGWRVHRVWVC